MQNSCNLCNEDIGENEVKYAQIGVMKSSNPASLEGAVFNEGAPAMVHETCYLRLSDEEKLRHERYN